jgi:hypothetical protein
VGQAQKSFDREARSMTSELAGIRKYLKRTKTLSQLEVLSNDLYAIADSEVIITNAGFEGGSTSGQARKYSKGDILNIVEDLIAELDPPAGDELPMARRLMVHADWSGSQAQV